MFETWIKEGAKFDGPEVAMETRTVVQVYIARNMSHDELAEKRYSMAQRNWKIGNPGEKLNRVETDNFSVIGNLVPSRLKEIAEIADKQQEELKKKLGITTTGPLFKGKLTVYAFNRRYEYSEYSQMVEKRKVPRDWRGHWNYTIVDAYASMAPPKEDDIASFDQTMAETIAGAYIETLGRVPNWFATGVARAVSAELHPKSTIVMAWDEQLPGIVSNSGGKPEGLFKGQTYGASASAIV